VIQTHIFCLKGPGFGPEWYGTAQGALDAAERQLDYRTRVWFDPLWTWEIARFGVNQDSKTGWWHVRIRRMSVVSHTRFPRGRYEYSIEQMALLSPRSLSDLTERDLDDLQVSIDLQRSRGVGKP